MAAFVVVILVTAIIRTVAQKTLGVGFKNRATRITYDVVTMLCGALIAAVVR